MKRRPIVSDFADVTKGSPKPSARDVARKPLFHGQRIDPALLLNKAKDAKDAKAHAWVYLSVPEERKIRGQGPG